MALLLAEERPGSGQGQLPTFRATTEAVPLLVAVTTRDGDFVTNLAVEDFEVLKATART